MNYYIIRATIIFKSKDDDVNIVFINRTVTQNPNRKAELN